MEKIMDHVTTYARSRAFACRKFKDELIVVPVSGSAADMDSIFVMNPVAAFVWDTVESKDLPGIVAAVCEEFNVTTDVATADVTAFLDELIAMKAVHVKEH